MVGLIAFATVVSTTATAPNTLGNGDFLENKGQWNSEAKFLLRQPGMNTWITGSGTVMDFYQESVNQFEDSEGVNRVLRNRVGDVVRVDFVGASLAVKPVGVSAKKAISNFISPAGEVNGVQSFAEARLVNVVPGVTARYYMDAGAPRYDVILAPGVSPSSVQLKYTNAKNLRVGADGSLEYDIRFGTVREQKLFVYQVIDGVKVPVSAKFSVSGNKVGFNLGSYDLGKPVVIDPVIFLNGTYLGGASGADQIGSVDTHPTTDAIIAAGRTAATNFPTSAGAYQTDQAGNDWFVSQLEQDLSGIRGYSTYIGGAGNEQGVTTTENLGVRYLNNGEVIFAGTTASDSLPTAGKSGVLQSARISSDEGYIIRLNGTGQRRYATYFGGGAADDLWDLDVNRATGDFAISLGTASTNMASTVTGNRGPLTAGAFAQTIKGSGSGYDAFVAIVSKDFDSVIMGTYFGGNDTDQGRAVAFNRDFSAVYLAGTSESTDMTWTRGTVQNPGGNDRDCMIARIQRSDASRNGTAAFGFNSQDDTVEDIVVNETTDKPTIVGRIQGAVNTPGWATSAFPVSYGYDSTFNGTSGTQNLFLATFQPQMQACVFTYFSGTGGNTSGKGAAIQANGSIHVVGYTRDPSFVLATSGGSDVTGLAPVNSSAGQQGFHARFSNGLNLISSTIIGGVSDSASDSANAVALFGTWDNAVVAGQTLSTTLRTSGSGAFLSALPGGLESGFLQTLAFTTKPVRVSFTSANAPISANFAVVHMNAPIINVGGQNVTFTVTGPARFSNGTQSIVVNVAAGSQSASVKVFPFGSIVSPTSVTVNANAQGVDVSNSFNFVP